MLLALSLACDRRSLSETDHSWLVLAASKRAPRTTYGPSAGIRCMEHIRCRIMEETVLVVMLVGEADATCRGEATISTKGFTGKVWWQVMLQSGCKSCVHYGAHFLLLAGIQTVFPWSGLSSRKRAPCTPVFRYGATVVDNAFVGPLPLHAVIRQVPADLSMRRLFLLSLGQRLPIAPRPPMVVPSRIPPYTIFGSGLTMSLVNARIATFDAFCSRYVSWVRSDHSWKSKNAKSILRCVTLRGQPQEEHCPYQPPSPEDLCHAHLHYCL